MREFHFPSALVTTRGGLMVVRFRARPEERLLLASPGAEPREKSFGKDADVILLVNGGEGLPDVPEFPVGEALFEGPSIEIGFRGKYVANHDKDGLHVYVQDGIIECLRQQGLPFEVEEVCAAQILEVLGDVAEMDMPPHRPPPAPPAGNVGG